MSVPLRDLCNHLLLVVVPEEHLNRHQPVAVNLPDWQVSGPCFNPGPRSFLESPLKVRRGSNPPTPTALKAQTSSFI